MALAGGEVASKIRSKIGDAKRLQTLVGFPERRSAFRNLSC
jgi:hypothetical protein